MIEQLLVGFVYSLSGFVIGFLAGRVTREVHEIRETVVPESFVTNDDHGLHATRLGVAVIVLSLLSVFGMAVTGYQAKQQADCQSAYNARFFEAFQARARANDQDRNALNELILSFDDPKLTPESRREAFSTYVESVRAANAERQRHPLPTPPDPRKLCERP